ncbi:phage tail domain-containing protein [Adlercreutzia sp. ZJ138]|uniref:phage distal tail protein n=1 Tax=Adlercreutzia sp. ZJ138 TaxID=2709405 RepID=UPI0013E9D150|nr:phage tail domain-containing protein [Adlercreutzia sp. ZJ138]
MRSIVYAGNDFSEICSAEVIERAANPIVSEAMAVPGRAGALLVSGYIPPVDVTVRLFMDTGYNPGFTGMTRMRGALRRWLSCPGGGSLVLPEDPEVEYRDAVLVGASAWSSLFETGECELTFTLFDPIGWGAGRVERTESFAVGGNWPTFPEFRAVAAAGPYVQVSLPSAGKGIRLDHEFAGGEVVVIDCAGEAVEIDGADACVCVALESDFFALEPGEAVLATEGCACVETRFFERWA